MTTCHEQIGQRAGHEQAMSVLLEPAITHLGKAEHPLDDPDRMFDLGPHFGLDTIFRPLDLIHNTAVAVAAIDEILGLWCVLPDRRPLAALGLVTLSATLASVTTSAWINLLQLSTPKCAFRPKYHWLPFATLAAFWWKRSPSHRRSRRW
jgi:hypothetical protein